MRKISEKLVSKIMDVLDKLEEDAVNSGDIELLKDINRFRFILEYGDGRPYIINPYINFMGECLKEYEGGSLEKTQENMRKCALKWRQLSKEDKKRYVGKSYKPGGVL